MGLLSRDQILQANDLPFEDVEVPEWGGTVRLRTLSGAERNAFEASLVEQRGRNTKLNHQNLMARLVALCLVDEQGLRLFGDDDVRALGKKSAKALDRVFERAQAMNGLSDEDVQDLAGNSDAAPSGSSTSG